MLHNTHPFYLMLPLPLRTSSKISQTIVRPVHSHLKQHTQKTTNMSTGGPPSAVVGGLNIENTEIQTAPGVSLSANQKTIVGSVLDLFAGRPSLAKLELWRDDATFADPLTIATGRDRYQAQWYGLQFAFSSIERLHHNVTDAGNPILMDLKTKYTIKGIRKEQTIDSVVAIYVDAQGKIEKVEDRWNGELPNSKIADVSSFPIPRSFLVRGLVA